MEYVNMRPTGTKKSIDNLFKWYVSESWNTNFF